MLHKNIKTSHHSKTRSNHVITLTVQLLVLWLNDSLRGPRWWEVCHDASQYFITIFKILCGSCVVSEAITRNCQMMLYLCVCAEKESLDLGYIGTTRHGGWDVFILRESEMLFKNANQRLMGNQRRVTEEHKALQCCKSSQEPPLGPPHCRSKSTFTQLT